MRRAGLEDVETLVGIQKAASLVAFAHIFPRERYPFPVQAVRERWRSAVAASEADVLLAHVGATPAGLVAVRPEWLDALYVIPELWGSGVAPPLHDAAVALLRDAGAQRCHLWVLEGNRRAHRFYERRGWRANARTRVVPFPPHPLDVGYTLDLRARERPG